MKTIKARGSSGVSVIVDDDVYEKIASIAWAHTSVAQSLQGKWNGKSIGLHRLIAGAKAGEIVRFRNGNDQDCRKENLILLDARKKEIPLRTNILLSTSIHQPVQTPEPTYTVTEYVKVEKPVLVAPTIRPVLIDINGKGQCISIDNIAEINTEKPDCVEVVTKSQTTGQYGNTQPITFEYTGAEAQYVRLQSMRLLDETGEKLISFNVELIEKVNRQSEIIEQLHKASHEANKVTAEQRATIDEMAKALADDEEKKLLKKADARIHALQAELDRMKLDMAATTRSYVEKEMAFAQEFIEVQAKHQRLVDKLKAIGFDVDTLMKS